MSNQPSSRTRRLQVERLESKLVLSASSAGMGAEDLSDDFYSQVSGAWFAEVAPSKELALDPQGAEAWIVRLSPAATAEAGNALGAVGVLSDLPLTVVRGLGKSGQLLVQAPAGVDLAADLARDARIAWAAPDAEVAGQLTPQDELYPQQEPALDQIGASDAWDNTTGSPTTVVGVIDSGITADHPDLYQNVWLNQGEIPASLRQQLVDTDGDQLITFYDLNAPANAGLVAESPDDGAANNYIDAYDILADPAWADGVDTDGNGFVDDFFGWNFRSAADEPFAPNDPSDAIGHGTQVAGIIGATASADPGGVGVAGINWQTSIMSLKFLDEQLQGAVSDAVRAINYATMMRLDFGVNLVATNNSWGQSGGFNSALFDAIQASGDAGILFVAAAGNGNALGLGIDNDQSPFYPASYDAPNVVSVAATGGNGDLAAFSNFGASSVDLAAPGVGVLSTVLAGAYATANGTSMAAPHVAGAAALLLSQPGLQGASLEEIKTALLSEVETDGDLAGRVATSGRLNIDSAFDHDGFAPQAELVSDPDVVITAAGPASHTVTIRYTDVAGIDTWFGGGIHGQTMQVPKIN
ncbi:MAG: S8 family peptidase [Planctomycetota bacterium]